MLLRIWQDQQQRGVGGEILPNTTGLIYGALMVMLVLLFAGLAYSKRSSIGRLVLPLLSRLMR